jgi:hypothetical protein
LLSPGTNSRMCLPTQSNKNESFPQSDGMVLFSLKDG